MRLIGTVSIIFVLTIAAVVSGLAAAPQQGAPGAINPRSSRPDGQAIFRFDTFGDEQLWTDVLRMHEAVATVSPATALSVGLKVDVDALPANIIAGASCACHRSGRSGGDCCVAAPECCGWCQRRRERQRPAHISWRDVRAVPLVGR